MVYVSMTGFRPNGVMQLPAFWWKTFQAFNQARRAPGNLLTAGRLCAGVYHTMTAWSDLASMRDYIASGAHLLAMKNFRKLGTGRVIGCACDDIPQWESVYALWQMHSREV